MPAPSRENNPLINRIAMLARIMPLMGVPYSYDGDDSNGFDCSGFTATIFASFLPRLPHSAQEQYTLGTKVDRDDLCFGDLVFFALDGDSPSHVGIYVGDGLFAHASVSQGVTISILDASYYRKRYLGARRVIR